jgi:hypothetical protein
LPSNFKDKRDVPFSKSAALEYLHALPPSGKAAAFEYVTKAPDFVKTPLRYALEQSPWFTSGRSDD